MKDNAVKRLNAITNLSSLGDGFNIAMKDLEIRGAGNMLGAEESGFIEEMGFSNYQKLLDEAITELKETKFKKASLNIDVSNKSIKCSIETDLELLIPNDYVSDVSERMNLYKRLSSIRNLQEIEDFKIELVDRFGLLPKATSELLKSIELRGIGEKIHCEKIILKQQKMILTFDTKNKTTGLKSETLNNIIKLIQKEYLNRYSIKEESDKIKLYVNEVDNIEESMKIINQINI